MTSRTRKRLESSGWEVGSVEEFLELTDEEARIVERELNREKSRETRRA